MKKVIARILIAGSFGAYLAHIGILISTQPDKFLILVSFLIAMQLTEVIE